MLVDDVCDELFPDDFAQVLVGRPELSCLTVSTPPGVARHSGGVTLPRRRHHRHLGREQLGSNQLHPSLVLLLLLQLLPEKPLLFGRRQVSVGQTIMKIIMNLWRTDTDNTWYWY